MKNRLIQAVTGCATLALLLCTSVASAKSYTLRNKNIQVSVNDKGDLTDLTNLSTGKNYASGGYLWRLYFDTPRYKEVQLIGAEQSAKVVKEDGKIIISYENMSIADSVIKLSAKFIVSLEADKVRFSSELSNNEPHTIIRELHYPLVTNMNMPSDYKLLVTHTGGQVYSNPKAVILRYSNSVPYRTPAQHFRQLNAKYPMRDVTAGSSGTMASNCFAFFKADEGLYFGSHDSTFQDTGHDLRLYPDESGAFTRLEAGFHKYPQCLYGESWSCSANVIAPYSGTWHETSKLYRQWADTWWDHRQTPLWVRKMKSWQRVIFRHQYGEDLFKYTDLPGRIQQVGASVGADVAFTFGWWQSGMDCGNPHYNADPEQGGDEGWKNAIAAYKKSGGKVLLYFNGKLIDRESEFYKSGQGKEICYKDNTGAEFTEQYRFSNQGTFLADFNARTFVIADTRAPIWRKMLIEWADRAREYGANSVFYDQLGYGERTTNWDLSKEFPIPNHFVIANKAEALKQIRDHNMEYDPEFALGTEWLTDVTAQYCDYIHIFSTTAGKNSFIDWFRYTFPDVVISDREIRDDTDIERRVNNALLKGLRNDIEIYRCRDLIDKTPHYQAYLAKVNEIKDRYADLLLLGTFRDTDGFTLSNDTIEARSFFNGNGLAIVATRTTQGEPISTKIDVPGYRYKESSVLGNAKVAQDGKEVTLGQYDLAVLVYEKLE